MPEPSSDFSNPYLPPGSNSPTGNDSKNAKPGRRGRILRGAFWSIVSAFPIAAVMAIVYRFPVPFAGYLSGIEAAIPAIAAVFVYGVFLGGFVLLGTLGALSAAIICHVSSASPRHQMRTIAIASIAITTVCLFVLQILDKIIGPW